MKTACIFLFLAASVEALRFPDVVSSELLEKQAQQPLLSQSVDLGTTEELEKLGNTTFEQSFCDIEQGCKRLSDLEDLHEGEAELIIRQMKRAGFTADEFKNFSLETIEPFQFGHYFDSKKAYLLHKLSIKEEENRDTDMSAISDFGKKVPKLPRSMVEPILQMYRKKTIRYLFTGRFYVENPNREWVALFVNKTFSNKSNDYFRALDSWDYSKNTARDLVGPYDYSQNQTGGFSSNDCGGKCLDTVMELSYWDTMKQSQFVLCPGMSGAYSLRFYEAMLTKTIPVINAYETDWETRGTTIMMKKIGYGNKMAKDAPHSYDEEMADLNLKKFIRYQTWLDGDNDPEQDEINGFDIKSHFQNVNWQ